MKMKSSLLPLLAGASLSLPCAGHPDVHLIQNASEAAAAKPSEMAAKLGFAAHVPKATEGYLSIIGANDMFERLKATELGQLITEVMGDQGMSLENEEEYGLLKAMVGEELFVAFGDTAGEQAVNLAKINNSFNYHTLKMVVKMAEVSLSPDPDFSQIEGVMQGMMKGVLNDSKAGLEAFKAAKMPPVTAGFKVSDEEMRSQLFDMMSGGVLMMAADEGFPGQEIDLKKDGVELTGVTLSGKKIAALARAEKDQDAIEFFGSEQLMEDYLTAFESKDFNIAVGQKGDYIVAFVGGSLDDLSFPAKVEDSLLGNEDIRILIYGEEEAFNTMNPSTDVLGSVARGLKAGLAESEFFGDTRDVQALLGHVARLEKSLVEMVEYTGLGGVGFLEDGFKFEVHGGSNRPSVDFTTPHSFSALGEMEDVVFFSNSRSNPEFTSELYELLRSLGEATYLMAKRTGDLEVNEPDFRDFKEGFQLFDQAVAKDLRVVWEAITVDWAKGTGDESAIIIDTKGTLPTVPGVPSPIIEEGLIPRIAYVTPVADREMISSSWKKIDASIRNILKTVREMEGPEIPMQAFEENVKDGVSYFTTQIQFSTPNARPVVGISDQHFFLATSPKFIGELNSGMAKKGPVRTGSYTHIDFSAARELAKYWVKLLKDNAEDIFENEFQRDDFKANLPMLEKFLAAFGELEEFTSHVRQVDGETRASVHFKMK